MKVCQACGSQCPDHAVFCTNCGTSMPNEAQTSYNSPGGNAYSAPNGNGYQYDPSMYAPRTNASDTGSIGYFFLGFFFPVVCFVVYFVIRQDYPQNAKKMLTGIIAGAVLKAVGVIAWFVLVFGFTAFAVGGGIGGIFSIIQAAINEIIYEFMHIVRTLSVYVLK